MYVSNNVILYSLSCFVFNRFMSVASQYSVVSPASVLSNQLFGRHFLRHSVTSVITLCFIMIFISLHFALYVILLHCVLGFSCFYYRSLCFICMFMLCCHMA